MIQMVGCRAISRRGNDGFMAVERSTAIHMPAIPHARFHTLVTPAL
ncbi:hypothetical protein [Mesorhizobium sp.]|nr:hypothetical protein [Mesorhizobium sp.]